MENTSELHGQPARLSEETGAPARPPEAVRFGAHSLRHETRLRELTTMLSDAQDALARHQQRFALIDRHSVRLHEATGLNQLNQFLVEAVRDVLPGYWVMVCMVNREEHTIEGVAAHGFPDGLVRDTVRVLYDEPGPNEDIHAYVWRTGEVVITDDSGSPLLHRPTVEKYGLSGPSVAVPIRDRSDVIGTLSVLRAGRSGKVESISEDDVRLLSVFANEAGIAIENLRLSRQLRNKGERLRDILVHVPAVIWEAWEGDEIRALRPDFVSDYVRKMVGYSQSEWLQHRDFWLRIVHPDDRQMAIDELEALRKTGERRELYFRWITKSGETLWVETSLLPVHDEGGETIGLRGVTIDITDRKKAEEQISRQQQLLTHGFMNELEEERRAMAYELHDGLTQYIMASHAFLDTYAERYRIVEGEGMPPDLEKGLRYLSQAVTEARRFVNNLRSLALDELGLAGALDQLLVEEKERAGWFRAELRHNIAERRFPTVLETAVFRVAQEALSNSRKHAETSQVRISVRLEPGSDRLPPRIALEVRDWGKGFEVQAKRRQYDRLGLHSMAEHLILMHGTFEIWSVPEEGTRIRAVFPIPEEESGGGLPPGD